MFVVKTVEQNKRLVAMVSSVGCCFILVVILSILNNIRFILAYGVPLGMII